MLGTIAPCDNLMTKENPVGANLLSMAADQHENQRLIHRLRDHARSIGFVCCFMD